MFQGLRIGSPVFVLFKDDMRLCTGEVTSVGTPRPVFNQMSGNTFLAPQYTVDAKVSIDGRNYEFNQLPGELDSFWYGGSSTLICEGKDALLREIENACSASQRHIDSVPYHEMVLTKGRKIISDLNPGIRKEVERSEKMEALSKQVEDLTAMVSEIFKQSKKEK